MRNTKRIRRTRRIRTRKGKDRRLGAALVEFAIIANVMFLLMFTCMEFARVNMIRNLTQDASYFAARVAMVPGATQQDARDEVDRILSSMVSDGYTVTVSNLNDEASDVSVTVTVDLDEVLLLTGDFFQGQTITSTAVMRTERYAGFYKQ